MTTRSPATHEGLDAVLGGPATEQHNPSRAALRSERKLRRDDDGTTRVYSRLPLETAAAMLTGEEGARAEVSTTSQLPFEDLEMLLRQVHLDETTQPSAMRARHEAASGIELEVSSITSEDLEAFRRGLQNDWAERDEAVSAPEAVHTTQRAARTAARVSRATLRWFRWASLRALSRGGAIAVSCARPLRRFRLALMVVFGKVLPRSMEAAQPATPAAESPTKTTPGAAAAK